MVESGKHHTSAVCSIAAVLITRIATCLRSGEPYRLRDVDGTPICVAEGRRIVKERYVVPESVRRQRRTVQRPSDDKTGSQKAGKGQGSGTKSGVARRSKVSAAPQPACTS